MMTGMVKMLINQSLSLLRCILLACWLVVVVVVVVFEEGRVDE